MHVQYKYSNKDGVVWKLTQRHKHLHSGEFSVILRCHSALASLLTDDFCQHDRYQPNNTRPRVQQFTALINNSPCDWFLQSEAEVFILLGALYQRLGGWRRGGHRRRSGPVAFSIHVCASGGSLKEWEDWSGAGGHEWNKLHRLWCRRIKIRAVTNIRGGLAQTNHYEVRQLRGTISAGIVMIILPLLRLVAFLCPRWALMELTVCFYCSWWIC